MYTIKNIYYSPLYKDGFSIVFNSGECINVNPSDRSYTICDKFICHKSYKSIRWGRVPKGVRKTVCIVMGELSIPAEMR